MSIFGKQWSIRERDPERGVLEKFMTLREGESSLSDLLVEVPEDHIHDPYLLHDMEKACERIEKAIADKERIVVFGDYDVDGVTATTCLVRTIKKLGGLVSYRIPHRQKDGYSLKNYFLDELHELGVKVVITVDNGIAAAREIGYANELGMDIVVTDHHNPPPLDELPVAQSIINPKLEACAYPFKELSGSAVAMKLCIALCERNLPKDDFYQPFIDRLYQVASIGIVADCMPLVGENKAIVKLGLRSLHRTPLRGLEALLRVAGSSYANVTAQDIAFLIGPRLNAAGRLDSAYDALHLFLNQGKSVEEIAQKLQAMNVERRAMTQQFVLEAKELLAEEGEMHEIIIVSSPNWNSGINGLVASRLCEEYARPVIVASEKDGRMTASCRSIDGFPMVDALRTVEDLLDHFGGHHGAAGCSFPSEHYYELVERLRGLAKLWLRDATLQGSLVIDTDVALHELTMDTLLEFERFEPFGIGNPKPLLLLEDVEFDEVKQIGAEKDHLSFRLGSVRGVSFRTGRVEEQLRGKRVDAVVTLERNVWKGNSYLQLHGKDFRVKE